VLHPTRSSRKICARNLSKFISSVGKLHGAIAVGKPHRISSV